MDPVQKTYFRQSWTQWWKSLTLIIQWKWKETLRKTCSWEKRWKTLYAKENQKKKKERKKYIMGYEYALLEKRRNRHTDCSRGRDQGADYRRAHGTERSSDDPAALLPTTWCFSFRKQAFPLSAVSWAGRLRKMQSITMAEGRTVEEPGSCFLVQMKSGAVTFTWWTLLLAWWA